MTRITVVIAILMVMSVLALPVGADEPSGGLVMTYTSGESSLDFGVLEPNTANQAAENEIMLTNTNPAVTYTSFDLTFQDFIGEDVFDLGGNFYLLVRNDTTQVGTFQCEGYSASFDYTLAGDENLFIRPVIKTVPSFVKGEYSGSFALQATFVASEGGYTIAESDSIGDSTLVIGGSLEVTHSYTRGLNDNDGVYIQGVTAGDTNVFSGGGLGLFDSVNYVYLKLQNTGNLGIRQVQFEFQGPNFVSGNADTLSISGRLQTRRASLISPSQNWVLLAGATPTALFTSGSPQSGVGGYIPVATIAYWEFGLTDIPLTQPVGTYEQLFQIKVYDVLGNVYTDPQLAKVKIDIGSLLTEITMSYVNKTTGASGSEVSLEFGSVQENSPAESLNAIQIVNSGETKIHNLWVHFNDFYPTDVQIPGHIQVGGNAKLHSYTGLSWDFDSSGNVAIEANIPAGMGMNEWYWLEILDVGSPQPGNYQCQFAIRGVHRTALGPADAVTDGKELPSWGDFGDAFPELPENPFGSPIMVSSGVPSPDDIVISTVLGTAGGGLGVNELIEITYSDDEDGLHWGALNKLDSLPDASQNTLLLHNGANTPIQRVLFQFGIWYPDESGMTPLFMKPFVNYNGLTYTGESIGSGEFRIEQIEMDVTINVGMEVDFEFGILDSGVDAGYNSAGTYISEFKVIIQRNAFSGEPMIETLVPQVAWISPEGTIPDIIPGVPSVISIDSNSGSNSIPLNYTHVIDLTLTVNTATKLVVIGQDLDSSSGAFPYTVEITKTIGESRVIIYSSSAPETSSTLVINSAGDYGVTLYIVGSSAGEHVIGLDFTGYNHTEPGAAYQGNTEEYALDLTVTSDGLDPIIELLAEYWYVIAGVGALLVGVVVLSRRRKLPPQVQEPPQTGQGF